MVAGRRHPVVGAQSIRSSYETGSPDYSTLAGEKPMSPQFENTFTNGAKIEGGPTLATSLKKRSKALSFSDLSRRFDASRAVGKPAAEQKDTVFIEGEGQRAQISSDAQTDLANEARLTNLITSNANQQAQSLDDKSKLAGSVVTTSYGMFLFRLQIFLSVFLFYENRAVQIKTFVVRFNLIISLVLLLWCRWLQGQPNIEACSFHFEE